MDNAFGKVEVRARQSTKKGPSDSPWTQLKSRITLVANSGGNYTGIWCKWCASV